MWVIQTVAQSVEKMAGQKVAWWAVKTADQLADLSAGQKADRLAGCLVVMKAAKWAVR